MPEDWREIEIDWQGGLGFVGHNPRGVDVQIGQVDDKPGASPMELVLMSLAGCTGMDVISILEKKKQNITDFKIKVRGLRKQDHPKSYTQIEVTFHFWGQAIDTEAVERAIHLSESKYCSVSAMLKEASNIHINYEIHQSEPELRF